MFFTCFIALCVIVEVLYFITKQKKVSVQSVDQCPPS